MREYEGHIDGRQATVTLFIVLVATLFLQHPQFLIAVGGPAGWQVALVMTAGAMLLFWPMTALAGRFPGMGLAEVAAAVAGPFLGGLLTLAASVWFLSTAALTLRSFIETFRTAILPDTPPSALILVALLGALYASYRGIEAIARSAQVLIWVIGTGVGLIFLFHLPRLDFAELYPIWGHGVLPTVTGGLYFSSMVAEAAALLAVGYAFRSAQHLRTGGIRAITLFGLVAALTCVVAVGVLGAPDAAQNPFPMFTMGRLIYLGRFMQRTEAVLTVFWFLAAAVRLSVLLHAGAVTLGGTLRLPLYRPLLFPLTVLLFAGSLVPEDFLATLRAERDLIRPWGFLPLSTPLLLWLLALLRRKGGAGHVA